jgi:hypothetical protein
MQIIELYINNTKVDLFEDESVSITDSIQNVRDISKIFTAFSQQFNLPASKTNNKLFRHYYNYEIENGFDARYKANAEIKLNGVTYKTGKIRLNTVDLKNNAPYSYKVVFFGDTIELKELLSERKLTDLEFDEDMNFEYTEANVFSKLTSVESGAPEDVVVPLITHSKRFEVHTNNKYTEVGTNNNLEYIDLKPAVRVKKIIEAIENSDLGISFSGDFFNSEEFNNLYLWLHRNEGYISNSVEGGSVLSVFNRLHLTTSENAWDYGSGTEQRPLDFSNIIPLNFSGNFIIRYYFEWDIQTTSTEPYQLLAGNNNEYINQSNLTGDNTVFFEAIGPNPATLPYQLPQALNIPFTVESENTFSMTQTLTVRLQYRSIYTSSYTTYETAVYNASTNDVTNTFFIKENMPDFKVFDFLINLFKMFNLTVFKRDDQLVVQPLNDFYNSGKRYEITEYVDMEKSNVSKLLQYKNIEFKFKSKKTQLVQLSDELQGVEFSQEDYGNDQWDGGDYKVEIDFEKMMYERLFDTQPDPDVLTPICQGTFIDKKGEPTIGKPLLLYCKDTDPDDYITLADNSVPTNYKRPSQIFENASNRTSLNFGLEQDEFFLQPVGTNLFENYYRDYIVNLFNSKARKLKVSAYLPLHIILRYKLNDRFVISGRSYKINTIKTNLLTNKSDLELIPDLVSISEIENGINPLAPRVAQPTVSTKNDNSITLTWTAVSGVTEYKLYVDDAFVKTTTSLGNRFSGLESGTTYKLGVQASYTNFDARVTDTFETTD